MVAFGCAWCSFSTSWGSFFKSLLRGFIAFRVLGTWHACASAKPPQVIPATTWIDLAPQTLRHPGCNFGATPQPTIGRRLIERLVEFLLLLQAEQRGRPFQALTLITDRLLASLIPTMGDGPNPSSGIPKHERYLIWRVAFLHQPQDVPMRSLCWVGCASIPLMKLFLCHFGGHGNSFCHTHSIHSLNGFDINQAPENSQYALPSIKGRMFH